MTACPDHPYSPLTHLGCVMCEGAKLASRDSKRRAVPALPEELEADAELPIIPRGEIPVLIGETSWRSLAVGD